MKNPTIQTGRFFNRKNLILLLLLVLLVVFRLIYLDSNPPGFFPDEASTGYDAWSLLEFGQDQHGRYWPLFFRSFADDISGTYRYMVVLSLLFSDLTVNAIRLPIAVCGISTVIILVLFFRTRIGFLPLVALSLIFTFSPWHILYCRTGQRIMLLPLGLVIFYWFFVKMLEKSSAGTSFLGGLCLGLTLYTYVAARLVVPALCIAVIICLLAKKPLEKKMIGLFIVGVFLASIPMIHHAIFHFDEFSIRFRQVSGAASGIGSRLDGVLPYYLSHFTPDFLLFEGDANLRHSQQHIGQLFIIQMLLVPCGLIYLLRRKIHLFFITFWILISPLPAALSSDGNPHALRSVSMLLPLTILTGLGLQFIHDGLRGRLINRLVWGLLLAFIFLEASRVSFDLFYRYPIYSAEAWQYGILEAVEQTEEIKHEYDLVWFTSQALGADRLIAFKLKINPGLFALSGLHSTKYRWHWRVPIEFVLNQFTDKTRVLFVVRENQLQDLPEIAPPILYPDGTTAFRFKSNVVPEVEAGSDNHYYLQTFHPVKEIL